MRFFSYGRKSVFSDKSDSIDNQFRMNREYCESKFSSQVDSWQQFSDEDFTGANTSRPDLQRMLSFIKGGFRPQYKKVKANLRRCLSDRYQMRRFFPDGSMASR